MTEHEWLALSASTFEEELYAVMQPRKLFLLGAAFLRRVEALLPNEAARFAVEVTEQYARGRAGPRDLLESWTTAEASMSESLWFRNYAGCPCWEGLEHWERETIHLGARGAILDPAVFATRAAWHARKLVGDEVEAEQRADAELREAKAQLDLYCDIVGDPFEKARPAPACVRHPTVRPLLSALAGMDRIDPVGMLALADALEEAGCAEADVIAHCRDQGPHFRGCWALEILAGRAAHELPLEA
jgi:hypothetical protein